VSGEGPGPPLHDREELADDLRRFVAAEPIRARPPSAADRAGRWVRRNRRALAAAAGVAVLAAAGVVGGLLWHGARLEASAEAARKDRDTAREERAWAEQAVDDMYTGVAQQWLARQPHLQPTQREFLEKAAEYYRRRSERDDSGPAARQQAARAFYRLGSIENALGRPDRAADYFDRAIGSFERLAADHPDEPEYRRDLSDALHASTLVTRKREPGEVERVLRWSVELAEGIATRHPGHAGYRHMLAVSRIGLAEALAAAGRDAEAERIYRGELPALRELAARPGAPPDRRNTLAACYTSLGNLLRATGRFEDAGPMYREAMAVLGKLRDDYPGEPDYRRRYAFNASNLGTVLLELKDQAGAEPAFASAADQYRRLAEDYPDVADYRGELVAILGNVAILQRRAGRPGDAARTYEEAADAGRKFEARFALTPFDRMVRATRLNAADAGYWQLLGLARYRTGDPRGTLDAFTTARELGRQQGPVGFVIAMVFWKLGEKDAARQWYARSVKWSEQNETEPGLRGLRAKAADLLGLTEIPPPREVVRPAKQ
jgi:tetratricopeptide (TPR) repeat protein